MKKYLFLLVFLLLPSFAVLSGFSRQAPLLVNSSLLTDFQGYINISWESFMNPDFSDITFTDLDDNLLSYWNEETINQTYATFYVKGDWNSTNGRQGYIYAGNVTKTSNSNGKQTFILFDDFNDDSINTTTWDITATPVESGGIITLQKDDMITSDDTSFTNGLVLRYKGWHESTDYNYVGFPLQQILYFHKL